MSRHAAGYDTFLLVSAGQLHNLLVRRRGFDTEIPDTVICLLRFLLRADDAKLIGILLHQRNVDISGHAQV